MAWLDRLFGVDKLSDEDIIARQEQVQILTQEQVLGEDFDFNAELTEDDQKLLESLEANQQVTQSRENNIMAVVDFSVTKDGQLDMEIRWDEESDYTADSLGRLLYHITSGTFTEGLSTILLNIREKNPKATPFIERCFKSWRSHKDDETMVKPSTVFKMGQQFSKGSKPQ